MIRTDMRPHVLRWLIGAVAGTALIAITSPLFVRSYLPHQVDPIRKVRTMPTGATYRWRSEGWANTRIGPLGMLGKSTVDGSDINIKRVALWGDSQAEGVAVSDEKKLYAQIEQHSAGRLQVFPFARSGDDLGDWVRQIALVESELNIDVHAILIVDLPDLLITPIENRLESSYTAVTALPAFVIQASRNLITDSATGSIRRLRFSIGPNHETQSIATADRRSIDDWQSSLARLRGITQRPIVLLYAPPVPQIVDGKLQRTDPDDANFAGVAEIAKRLEIQTIDLRDNLITAAESGDWPFGYHNGRIGSGHLNKTGYAVIAASFVEALIER